MEISHINDAVGALEKANANLEPELLTAGAARELLACYARAEKLASYGRAVLARRVDDVSEVARVTGTCGQGQAGGRDRRSAGRRAGGRLGACHRRHLVGPG